MKKLIFAIILMLIPQVVLATDTLESPSDMFFEFKAGKFVPNVDKEFGGSGPFKDIFGTGGSILYNMQLDYRIFKGFGSLYVGSHAGFYWISGKALLLDGSKSDDETAMWLFPVGIKVTYRFDEFLKRWSIPLVPYVKLGLLYTFWFVTEGDGSIAEFSDGGAKARGGTYGWEFAAGLALQLNIFDPTSARNLDIETGINATYLFAEWVYNSSDKFGADKALSVGGDYFLFGLGFEF